MLKAICFQHSAICFFTFHSLFTEIIEKVAEIKKPKKLAFSIQKKLTARTTCFNMLNDTQLGLKHTRTLQYFFIGIGKQISNIKKISIVKIILFWKMIENSLNFNWN